MHLLANDKKAQQIQRILINGKPVVGAIEFDDTEGWVDVAIPKITSTSFVASDDKQINPSKLVPSAEWDIKRLNGTIQVIWDSPNE